jgi:nucleoside-diphosphate-sugar epimerase
MNKRVVVTGAHGFIGKNLIEHLIDDGYEIYNLPHDVLKDSGRLQSFMWDKDPQTIYHLSAYGNKYDQLDPYKTVQANYVDLVNVLEAIKSCENLKCFVNFSTSSVYGKQTEPMHEDMICCPNSLYALTKFQGEALCRYYVDNYKMPIVNVRPFSVFGEYDAVDKFIGKVCLALIEDSVLTLDPNPMHDWIYIHDFLNAVEACIQNIDKLVGKTVNIGSGKQYKNEEIVRMLEKVSGKLVSKEITQSLRNYDTDMWVADIWRIKSFGWKPLYTLEEALRNTYESYKK